VASVLSQEPAVLAHDLLNEPWPGDTNDPALYSAFMSWWFNSPAAERELLLPFYRALAAEIRKVDPRHIIAYEPVRTQKRPASDFLIGMGRSQAVAQLGLTLLHVYCAIHDAPPTPLFFAIHHTILVLAISCNGQRPTHPLRFVCFSPSGDVGRVDVWVPWGGTGAVAR